MVEVLQVELAPVSSKQALWRPGLCLFQTFRMTGRSSVSWSLPQACQVCQYDRKTKHCLTAPWKRHRSTEYCVGHYVVVQLLPVLTLRTVLLGMEVTPPEFGSPSKAAVTCYLAARDRLPKFDRV